MSAINRTRTVFFGREGLGVLRRAVKCVLAKQEGHKFDCLEITKIVSKRFLSIPFISVTAHSRHIQQGVGLIPAKNFALTMPVEAPPRAGVDSDEQEHHGEVAPKQYAAVISSS